MHHTPTPADPGLSLSPAATHHLQQTLKGKEGVAGVRVGVKKAGCSGYEYVLELCYNPLATDFCFTSDTISIYVDATLYWKFFKGGTVMDYEKKGVQSAITFHNPNVAAQCGCGESFTLVDED